MNYLAEEATKVMKSGGLQRIAIATFGNGLKIQIPMPDDVRSPLLFLQSQIASEDELDEANPLRLAG